MGNFFTDLFGGSKPEQPELRTVPKSPEEIALYAELLALIERAKNIEPRDVAGMTSLEAEAQGVLGEYFRSDVPISFMAGQEELLKTISGGYDPSTSRYWKGLRDYSKTQEETAVGTQKRSQQIRGMFTSSPGLAAERKLRGEYATRRDVTLGGLTQVERDKIFNSIALLLGYAGMAEDIPKGRLGTVAQYGSLPRDIQNMIYGAQWEKEIVPFQVIPGAVGQAAPLAAPTTYFTSGMPAQPPLALEYIKAIASLLGGSGGGGTSSASAFPPQPRASSTYGPVQPNYASRSMGAGW